MYIVSYRFLNDFGCIICMYYIFGIFALKCKAKNYNRTIFSLFTLHCAVFLLMFYSSHIGLQAEWKSQGLHND